MAGFEVDLMSEKGTYVPDWLGLQKDILDGDYKKQWEDESGEFRQKLDKMPVVGSIDRKKYGLFYASAGHAALNDYSYAEGLQKIATDV